MAVQNRQYLIIGASGGIGSALTKMLCEAGATVYLAARDEAKLKILAEQYDMPYKTVDATNVEAVENFFAEIFKQYPDIYGVVNLAGNIMLKPAHLLTLKEWEETIAQNLTSAFACVRSASKQMMKKGGSVVLMTTAACLTGMPYHEAIAAAKAGVIGLMQAAAATYAANHLRFNCVAPGLVQTPMSEHITKTEKARKISLASHPLGRLGEPEDIARMILFLLDPANDWISGQVFAVDGGLSRLQTTPVV